MFGMEHISITSASGRVHIMNRTPLESFGARDSFFLRLLGGSLTMTAQFFGVPFSEEVGYFLEGTHSIDQFFDFLERSEHALVNLNPHFALMRI